MKRKHLYLLSPLMVIGFLFSSCNCKCPAENGFPINIDLYNFSANDVDSIVVKLYTSSSNFSNPIDSTVYHAIYINSTEYEIQVDGADTLVHDTSLNILVYIPKDNLIYKISQITAKTEYTSSIYVSCCGTRHMPYLEYTGYSVNNVPYTIPKNYDQSSPTITITK